ncbi:MAG TPA: hypothetical protein PKX16_10335, partial [Kiritimatiellia bacterium]|nr:hypothetical protein [Kiritimatiellia bacterium]
LCWSAGVMEYWSGGGGDKEKLQVFGAAELLYNAFASMMPRASLIAFSARLPNGRFRGHDA